MQHVRVEEQRGSGRHFAIHVVQVLQREFHPLRVGPHLCTVTAVLDPSQAVRTPDDLEATVRPVGPVHRDVATGHIGIQRLVVVPVAVVLVPLPGSADAGFLDHHLVMVQVDLVAHEPFHRVDHPPAVADSVVDVLAVRVRRQPQLAFAALGVLGCAYERGLLPVGTTHTEQEFHFLLVIEAFHHQVAVFPEPSFMFFRESEHGMLPVCPLRPRLPFASPFALCEYIGRRNSWPHDAYALMRSWWRRSTWCATERHTREMPSPISDWSRKL